MARFISMVALVVLLSGCSSLKAFFDDEKPVPGDFCDTALPHYHSKKAQDAMTDRELRRETSHNEQGEQDCGWKAQKR